MDIIEIEKQGFYFLFFIYFLERSRKCHEQSHINLNLMQSQPH